MRLGLAALVSVLPLVGFASGARWDGVRWTPAKSAFPIECYTCRK